MPQELSKEQLQRLARLGARARLDELEAERRAILRAFPGLSSPLRGGASTPGEGEHPAATGRKPRRRRKQTAAQRKAQSERMRKYWAERRKAQG